MSAKPVTFVLPSHEEYIPLIQLLKVAGIARSGGEAQQLVVEQKVRLNGAVEMRKRAKVREGDVVECLGATITIGRE